MKRGLGQIERLLFAYVQLRGQPTTPILTFAGVMRVTRTCSRRSAATAASMESAARSPLTV